MAALCGGGGKGASMRDKLALVLCPASRRQTPAGIRLYDGLGKVHFPISTPARRRSAISTRALGFAYGFNHAAAIASFREAQRLDPNCAMCCWGEALAHGPTSMPRSPPTPMRWR